MSGVIRVWCGTFWAALTCAGYPHRYRLSFAWIAAYDNLRDYCQFMGWLR